MKKTSRRSGRRDSMGLLESHTKERTEEYSNEEWFSSPSWILLFPKAWLLVSLALIFSLVVEDWNDGPGILILY